MLEGYLGLIGATLLLTASFSFMIASTNIEEIKNNWDKKRCEIPIMISAGMFRPDFYKGSSTEFAKENFEFCTRKIADEVIKLAFAPFFTLAKEQMNVQSTMAGPMNSIRSMITKAVSTFSDYMKTQFLQYKAIIVQLTKTTQHLKFAMGRVEAIAVSILYMFYSVLTLVNNTVKFAMTAAWVFVGMMAALIIILWFGLLPFLFIILPLVAVLAAAGSETNFWLSPFSDGFIQSAFCVDPAARVLMADGSIKTLQEVKIGDVVLRAKGHSYENRITGKLVVNASKEALVSIYGVCMSTTHRVLYEKTWILAKDHPDAQHVAEPLQELICLNTTHHDIAVLTDSDEILHVGDWEEVDSWEGQRQWIDWVDLKLNGATQAPHRYPTTVPLCGPELQVICQDKGWIPLASLQMGDVILGEKGWTKVIGLYTGAFEVEELPKHPDWISDGVWMKANRFWLTRGNGVHEAKTTPCTFLYGHQCITEDGTFVAKQAAGIMILRDFTEAGADAISESYSWLDIAINKKRSS